MREYQSRRNDQAAQRVSFAAAAAAAILLLWAPDAARADEVYEAVLSCTHQEKTVHVLDCLDDGELLVESEGHTQTYLGEDIPRTVQYGQTLRIPLSIKFHILAESANRQQLLRLVVVDFAGNVLFRDDSRNRDLVMAENR
jgi:hypothetical protein